MAIIGMVALLSWLLFKGFSPEEARIGHALRILDSYQSAESALHRDVLSARAGILKSYDPLSAEIVQMDDAMTKLRETLKTGEERRYGAMLYGAFRQQDALSEQFKSRNALVQNSLAYFAVFTIRLSTNHSAVRLRSELDRVSSAMLNLSLAGDAAAATVLAERLDALQRRCPGSACGSDVEGLLQHGRLLSQILPETAVLIGRLTQSSGGNTAAALDHTLLVAQGAAEDRAGRYRILLYLGSVLLAYLLVSVVMQVRAHAAALRKQVALEHAVAAVSTRLIATPPERLDREMHEALGDLGRLLGASHAWLHLAAERRDSVWPIGGIIPPACWAKTLITLAPQGRTDYAVVVLHRRAFAPQSAEREALDAAKIESGYCIVPPAETAARNILAFGFAKGHHPWATSHLAVLGAALDSLSMALDHAKLQEERSRLGSQLGQARRMETVGAFASGIAHNFNNLLGAISGHVEMALGELGRPDALRNHVEQIGLSADRGRHLVQGLLTFGRRYEHHRQATDLASLLAESAKLAEAGLAPKHSIETVQGLPTLTVLADGAQLQQVILNLCHNSAQAMPDGGTIRIALAQRGLDAPLEVGGHKLHQGEYAVVSVIDTGIGIAPAVLRRIYEPFFTTKASGTGLGLSTAREIVHEQGGALLLESVVGEGTTATIWLPLLAQGADGTASQAPLRGGGEIVLLVVPHAGLMRAEDILAAIGYEPVGFATVEAATEALRAAPARFDALLTGDVPLDADTEALLHHARKLAPNMPRLFAVTHAADHDAAALAGAGVTAVLKFPLKPREVTLALRRSLQTRSQD